MPGDIIRITNRGKLLAIIIRARFKQAGIKFFVPEEYAQQLGYMNRPKGHVIVPHIHKPILRKIRLAQEVLFIRKGRVRVDFYDEKRDYAESRILKRGDVVFLAFGGHGFKFMEDSEMMEVKQGPFLKEAQPIRFETVKKIRMGSK